MTPKRPEPPGGMPDDWRTEVPAEYTRAVDFFRGQDDEGLLTERAKAVIEYVGWLERRLDGERDSVSEVDPMSKPHSTKPSQEDGADPCGSKAEREV